MRVVLFSLLLSTSTLFAAGVQRMPGFVITGFAVSQDGTLYATGSLDGWSGIFRFGRNGLVKVVAAPIHLGQLAVSADGSFWMTAPNTGGIFRSTGGGPFLQIMPNDEWAPGGLMAATDGAIWYGPARAAGKFGAVRIASDGTISQWPLEGAKVYALAPGAAGTMWLVVGNAVYHVAPSGSILSKTPIDSGSRTFNIAVATPDGGVLVSGYGMTHIEAIDAAGVRTGRLSLPPDTNFSSVFLSGDAIYVGTDGSLLRYKSGMWARASVAPAPPPFDAGLCKVSYYHPVIAVDAGQMIWAGQRAYGFYPGAPGTCMQSVPLEITSALLRVDDAAFVPLMVRKRAAGR